MNKSESSERTLMHAGDVARRLGLGRRAVLYFARQGTIPVVRVGRYVRFDPLAIEEWIDAGGRALAADWRNVGADPK